MARSPEALDLDETAARYHPIIGFAEEERRAELTAAVRALPLKYRDVLDLYYYRELSREETARRIGLTPAQVSERVHYAQKLLRNILRRERFPFLPDSHD